MMKPYLSDLLIFKHGIMKNVPEIKNNALKLFSDFSNTKIEMFEGKYFEDSLTNYFRDNKKARLTDELYKSDYDYIQRIAQL